MSARNTVLNGYRLTGTFSSRRDLGYFIRVIGEIRGIRGSKQA